MACFAAAARAAAPTTSSVGERGEAPCSTPGGSGAACPLVGPPLSPSHTQSALHPSLTPSHTSPMALRQAGSKRARPQLTRLHDAVRRYDVLAVKTLIAGGAKLEVDSFGRTALHLAVSAASQGRSAVQDAVVLEMVTALLSGVDTAPPLCLHCDGLTPLHLAARFGNSRLMSILLSMCAALIRPHRPPNPEPLTPELPLSQRRRRGSPRRDRHEDAPHGRALQR